MKRIIGCVIFMGVLLFGGISFCNGTTCAGQNIECPDGCHYLDDPNNCTCVDDNNACSDPDPTPPQGTDGEGTTTGTEGEGTATGTEGEETNESDCPENQKYRPDGTSQPICCPYPVEDGKCPTCPSNREYTIDGQTLCCPVPVDENNNCNGNLSDMGININTDCLLNGSCSLNVYEVMGIRESNQEPTVLGLFQDITLASTTVILGTVLVIAMIVGGLSRAFASLTGKDTKKGKDILISCFVGMLLVLGSYAIIRVIQFLATGGGG